MKTSDLKMVNSETDSSVKKAMNDFYKSNDFDIDGGEKKKIAWIKFGFFSLPIPNVKSRRDNIYLHDLNHIITDNNTSWKGESAVSSWEIASGGWSNFYFIWFLTLWSMGLGVLFYPKEVLKSFHSGLSMKNALTSGLTKSELLNHSVSGLRETMSNKPKIEKNPYYWMFLSLIVFISPFFIGILILIKLYSLIY